MIKVKVLKNNEIVQFVKFETQDKADAWIEMLAETASWGKPDRWISDLPLSPLSDEEKALATSVLEIDDPILGFYKKYFFPAEYTIEIEDITEQVEAELAQIEAIKNAQIQAGLRLQTFDSQIDECQDLGALKLAIKQMIQDIAILLK